MYHEHPIYSLFLVPGLPRCGSCFCSVRPDGVWVVLGTHQAGMGVSMVVELFKFIHPHFSCTYTVGQSLFARVGRLLGENVANMRTRVCLQGTAALPDLHTKQRGRGGQAGNEVLVHNARSKEARRRSHDEHCQALTLHGAGGHFPRVRPQNVVRVRKAASKTNEPPNQDPKVHARKPMHLTQRSTHS